MSGGVVGWLACWVAKSSPPSPPPQTYLGRAGTPVHTLGTATHPVVAVKQVNVDVSVAVHSRVGHLDRVLAVIELQVLGGIDELEIRGIGPGERRKEGEGRDEKTHGWSCSVCVCVRGGVEGRRG